LDVGYRTKGVLDHRQGRFAMGLQVGFFPTLSVPATLPYEIWHVKELNLSAPFGVVTEAIFGDVRTSMGDMFLARDVNIPFETNTSYLSLSPSGDRVLELDRYDTSLMTMDLLTFTVPVRWYFFTDAHKGVRPFVDLGLGFDVIFTKAKYNVTNELLLFDFDSSSLTIELNAYEEDEPLRGAVSSSLLLTRSHIGVGAAYKRWELGIRGQWSITQELPLRGIGYERVRGNMLAIPFLADVANDGQVVAEVERNGALTFARTGLSREDGGTEVSDYKTYNGVSRFWDHATWLLSLSIKLR
jgi:hypothetical protein